MNHMECEHCGNSYHWSEAFAKFGFNDGDGKIETPYIAQMLEKSGYEVKYARWSPHNTLIHSITKNGIEYMPDEASEYRIGYDHPQEYLPVEILDLLNIKTPPVMLFIQDFPEF
jgi:hypothetical protein